MTINRIQDCKFPHVNEGKEVARDKRVLVQVDTL